MIAGAAAFLVGLVLTIPLARAMFEIAWVRSYLLARDGVESRNNWN